MPHLSIDTVIDLAVVVCATWYIAHAVTSTNGPFKVFQRLRNKMPLGGLTTCIKCLAPWTAAILLVLWYSDAWPFVVCLGVAGAAIMLGSYSGASHV